MLTLQGIYQLLISLVVAPLFVYELGIPLLPSQPRASDSQLAFFYAFDTPLIGGAVWLLRTAYKYLLHGWSSSSGPSMPKPQSMHSSQSQAWQTTHDDPIVIGGGREKNEKLFWFLILEGIVIMISGIFLGDIWVLSAPKQGLFSHGMVGYSVTVLVCLVIGLGLIIGGIVIRPYGKRRACLKIGSEGIAYSEGKDHLFIPWNEISRAYVDTAIISKYLYVKLNANSRLHFLEPIKSRYAKGVIVICGVSNSSSSIIPKHLVENALDIYAP